MVPRVVGWVRTASYYERSSVVKSVQMFIMCYGGRFEPVNSSSGGLLPSDLLESGYCGDITVACEGFYLFILSLLMSRKAFR